METEMKECPYCKEQIFAEATKCRFCKSPVGGIVKYENTGCRDLSGRMLAGVAAYLAKTMGISVSIVRIAFVIGTVFAFPITLAVYAAVWIMIPFRESDTTAMDRLMDEGRRQWRKHRTARKKRKSERNQEVIVETSVSRTE